LRLAQSTRHEIEETSYHARDGANRGLRNYQGARKGSCRLSAKGCCQSDHRKPGVVSAMNARALIAALLLATSGGAFAQGTESAGAINAGQVGEQADGFLRVRVNVPNRIRA